MKTMNYYKNLEGRDLDNFVIDAISAKLPDLPNNTIIAKMIWAKTTLRGGDILDRCAKKMEEIVNMPMKIKFEDKER